MINIFFKFEDKIQNASKVHKESDNDADDDPDDDDNHGTKNNMSSPGRGGEHNENFQNECGLCMVM